MTSQIGQKNLLAARRILADPQLPEVTAHGDFHVGNLLYDSGAVWVVDWEQSGRRPSGFDLLRLWSTLPFAWDRDQLFDATIELVGPELRHELTRLRYAVLVTTITTQLVAPQDVEDNGDGAIRILGLLPAARDAALRSNALV